MPRGIACHAHGQDIKWPPFSGSDPTMSNTVLLNGTCKLEGESVVGTVPCAARWQSWHLVQWSATSALIWDQENLCINLAIVFLCPSVPVQGIWYAISQYGCGKTNWVMSCCFAGLFLVEEAILVVEGAIWSAALPSGMFQRQVLKLIWSSVKWYLLFPYCLIFLPFSLLLFLVFFCLLTSERNISSSQSGRSSPLSVSASYCGEAVGESSGVQ